MNVSEADIEALEKILHMAEDMMVQGKRDDAPPAAEEPPMHDEEAMGEEEPALEIEVASAPEEEEPLEEYHFRGGAVKPQAPKFPGERNKAPVAKRGRY